MVLKLRWFLVKVSATKSNSFRLRMPNLENSYFRLRWKFQFWRRPSHCPHCLVLRIVHDLTYCKPGPARHGSAVLERMCRSFRDFGKKFYQLYMKHKMLEEWFWFDLPKSPNASASTVLSQAEGCVRSLFKKHPAVFKVGITSNPIKRWNHSRYGYAFDKIEGWLGMKILAVCETSFCAGMLESALIRIF